MTTATEKKDYLVFVGPGHCTITSLTETELFCRPPIKEPTTRLTKDKLFIRVRRFIIFDYAKPKLISS